MSAPVWSTACPDWEQRIVAGKSLVPFDPLFPDAAADALAVFKSLRMHDVPGQPTFGEAGAPFVFDFVEAIFGAYDAETGIQHITEFLLLISKKNGKSTIAAGIMLTALILNRYPGTEMLVVAPTIEAAQNSFKPLAAMIRLDPELDKLFHIVDHQRKVTHLGRHAELKIAAADANVLAGKKAAFVLFDEVWLFGKQPDAGAMMDEATGGQISRKDGFTVYLSTHSDEAPAGVWNSILNRFRAVRDGEDVDNSMFGMMYEFPNAMIDAKDYLRPENFYITNPNLGRSVSQQWLEKRLRQRQSGEVGDDGEDLQSFTAKHLNVQIGLRLRRNRWPGADHWEETADSTLTLDALLARSEVVTIGIDGGGRDDLLGLCVMGRERGTDIWLSWCKAWGDPDVLERHKQIAPLLRDFERAGDFEVANMRGGTLRALGDLVAKIYATGLLPDLPALGLTRSAFGWCSMNSPSAASMSIRMTPNRWCGASIKGFALAAILARWRTNYMMDRSFMRRNR